MRKLKFVEKFKLSQVMNTGDTWIYHYRAYTVTELPERVFVEKTTARPDGEIWRTWYCPTIPEYRGYRKTKSQSLGGTYSLSGWFEKYLHKRKDK